MPSILTRMFGRSEPAPDNYSRAMAISGDLLDRMQRHSRSNEPALAVMADLWAQRNNIPYMTAVVVATQEMNAPLQQRPEDK